jgi:hypothetical protein
VKARGHPSRNGNSIPGIDHGDSPNQLSEFFYREVRACLLPHPAWHVLVGDQRDGVGKSESGALLVVEEGRLVPGGERMEALLALAGPARDLRVHVDAVSAAVQD